MAGAPEPAAWVILAGAAAVGTAFFIWSYNRALVEIAPWRRILLCGLRSVLWLGLMLLLAAPTRIHRSFEQPPKARPLAVLVDRSGSMTTPDNRQRRRLDDALVRWHGMERAARAAFGSVQTFAFASDMRPAPTDETSVEIGPGQTRLFSALQGVLAAAPVGGWSGVVTLTDGLDTGGTSLTEGVEATARAALGQSTPLFFVAGRNRYAGVPFFGLRDFEAPAQAAPRSTFRVEAIFDSYQALPRSVSVQFKVDGVTRPAAMLRLAAGRQFKAWSADVQAGDEGRRELELRVGDEIARAEVRILRPPTHRILYFQGALDWSYRFLADILTRDSTFALTPVFNFPNSEAALPPGALRRMPEIPKGLDGFDIVILANAVAAQFTDAQQAALDAWVRDGGVVLFFTPDDDSTDGFAGSELEKMLPVRFASAEERGGDLAHRTLAKIVGDGSTDDTQLHAFDWEKTARVREIFAEAEKANAKIVSPLFAEYAHVAQAKPGADVLARHPSDLAPNGSERAILLAIQRYGRGQSAVLTTDALWRWKLNQPSEDRSSEVFWQTLFAWLTRERQYGLRFEETPRVAEVGREISARVAGAAAGKVRAEAVKGDERLALNRSQDEKVQTFVWRPPSEGLWRLDAVDASGAEAVHWVSVRKSANTGEFSGAPPDEELLRALAERTGGAVLENEPPVGWQKTQGDGGALLGEQREYLWHRSWILWTMLCLYAAEMILRRIWRML